MVTGYAPEYSQEAINKLASGYNQTLDPQYQAMQRKLKQAMVGNLGSTGYIGKMGDIEMQRLADVGKYTQNLQNRAMDAAREERLLAEQRAYEDPWREKQYGLQARGQALSEELGRGNLGLAKEQFGETRRQFDVGQGNWAKQFSEGQRQFDVGQGNWQKQFGEGQRQFDIGQGNWQKQFGEGQRQFDIGQQNWLKNFDLQERGQAFNEDQAKWGRGVAEAGLSGYYKDRPTMQRQQFEDEMRRGSYADQTAAKAGFANAQEMAIYQADPEAARKMGIWANQDYTEIQRLVDEGPSGDAWLYDHFRLTRQQARNVLNKRQMPIKYSEPKPSGYASHQGAGGYAGQPGTGRPYQE